KISAIGGPQGCPAHSSAHSRLNEPATGRGSTRTICPIVKCWSQNRRTPKTKLTDEHVDRQRSHRVSVASELSTKKFTNFSSAEKKLNILRKMCGKKIRTELRAIE